MAAVKDHCLRYRDIQHSGGGSYKNGAYDVIPYAATVWMLGNLVEQGANGPTGYWGSFLALVADKKTVKRHNHRDAHTIALVARRWLLGGTMTRIIEQDWITLVDCLPSTKGAYFAYDSGACSLLVQEGDNLMCWDAQIRPQILIHGLGIGNSAGQVWEARGPISVDAYQKSMHRGTLANAASMMSRDSMWEGA